MDSLLKAICQYPNGTGLVIEWPNNYTIWGTIDTIYEFDDYLNPGDDDYHVLHICVLLVTNVMGNNPENISFSKGTLIEISRRNSPLRVKLYNGTLVWEA